MKKIIFFAFIIALCANAQEKQKTISFKKDVLPILTKKCLGCHNTDDGSPCNLYFDDYSELVKGDSKHGPVIIKGKGEESILVMKLRGTSDFGKQMPRGRKPLDEEMIDIVCQWINQGAKNN